MNLETLAVAMTGGVGLILSTTLPVILSNRRTKDAVAAVHDEVRTNHGQRAGDYLEGIADLKEFSSRQTALFEALAKTWADHTIADAVSFEEISTRLGQIEAEMRRRRSVRRGTDRLEG